jgi:hypothetical protein
VTDNVKFEDTRKECPASAPFLLGSSTYMYVCVYVCVCVCVVCAFVCVCVCVCICICIYIYVYIYIYIYICIYASVPFLLGSSTFLQGSEAPITYVCIIYIYTYTGAPFRTDQRPRAASICSYR